MVLSCPKVTFTSWKILHAELHGFGKSFEVLFEEFQPRVASQQM